MSTRKRHYRWDAFISHSWADKGGATSIVEYLRKLHDCKVWVDYENLSRGAKLDQRITADLARSRVVLVLWSKSARRSRWVVREVQAAARRGCDILPCLLDDTSLEGHPLLAGRLYCDFSSSFVRGMSQLMEKLYQFEDVQLRSRAALEPHHAKWPKDYPDVLLALGTAQERMLEHLFQGQQRQAAQLLARFDPIVAKTLNAFPHDPDVVSLAGYQRKDAYQVKIWRHWRDAKVRQRHRSLLDEAERLFYEALSLRPHDAGALNGLGSVAGLRGDTAMAEHFALRAAEAARQQGIDYDAAGQDVALFRSTQRARDDATLADTIFVMATGGQGGTLVLRFAGIAQALPIKVQNGLLGAMAGFVVWLGRLGVAASTSAELRVVVDPESSTVPGYDADRALITARPIWVRDSDVFARLVGLHAFGQMLQEAHKKSARGGAPATDLSPLVSGLADYCACSYHDDARLGSMAAPVVFGHHTLCLRDLRTDLKRSELIDGAPPQEAGTVWGAALWELRERLGASAADSLVLGAWQTACTPAPERFLEQRFAKQLLELAQRSAGWDKQVRVTLRRRGLMAKAHGAVGAVGP